MQLERAEERIEFLDELADVGFPLTSRSDARRWPAKRVEADGDTRDDGQAVPPHAQSWLSAVECDAVNASWEALPERRRIALAARMGHGTDSGPLTYRQAGEQLGVSRERARQLAAAARSTLTLALAAARAGRPADWIPPKREHRAAEEVIDAMIAAYIADATPGLLPWMRPPGPARAAPVEHRPPRQDRRRYSVQAGSRSFELCAEDPGLSDGLGDLVEAAVNAARVRLREPAGWAQVTSMRSRHAQDPAMPGRFALWAEEGAHFVTESCDSVASAKILAAELLGPQRHWRTAVVWRTGDQVHIQAQDSEADEASALVWSFSIVARPDGTLDIADEGALQWTADPPLRAPTWSGSRWTLRSAGAIAADLDVTQVAVPLVHGTLTPRDAFGDVSPALARFGRAVDSSGGRLFWANAPPTDFRLALNALRDSVALHDPNGNVVPGFAVFVRRAEAWWTWLLPPVN